MRVREVIEKITGHPLPRNGEDEEDGVSKVSKLLAQIARILIDFFLSQAKQERFCSRRLLRLRRFEQSQSSSSAQQGGPLPARQWRRGGRWRRWRRWWRSPVWVEGQEKSAGDGRDEGEEV